MKHRKLSSGLCLGREDTAERPRTPWLSSQLWGQVPMTHWAALPQSPSRPPQVTPWRCLVLRCFHIPSPTKRAAAAQGSGQMHGRGHGSLCPPARTCSKYVSVIPAQPAGQRGCWGGCRQGEVARHDQGPAAPQPCALPVPRVHQLLGGIFQAAGGRSVETPGPLSGPHCMEGGERKQPRGDPAGQHPWWSPRPHVAPR